ncbi:MAG TPA: amidase [Anaerolineales bacterium]|nr:amidase [Anaerolineales bacterium]
MDLTDLTLAGAAGLLAGGEISPVELAQAHLERIAALEGRLNCFITVSSELALEQARQAEAEIGQGEYRGALHGLPLALKDLYDVEGVRTTAGSKFFSDHVPTSTAAAVQKLLDCGAVLLGKLNMHEIALGVTNDNPHFGATHNPWNLDRTPGGSSGGSAAALSAGLCMGSLGSDTGGSIRIPASLCGIVGLKPTFGRVSLRGVFPLSWNLDHAGPLARRVKDVALLLQAVAGYDPDDPASVDRPVPDYLSLLEEGVQGWRIALADDPYFNAIDPEVLEAVRAAAKVFEELGAEVVPVEFPGAREAAFANGLVVVSDGAAFHRARLAEHPEDFGQDVRQRLQTGAAYTSSEYILARRAQVELRRSFERFFEGYHILLTPATPIPAPPLQGPDAVEQARRLTRFTAPFNLTGLPALSLPCGFTKGGLPIGLQIVGSPWGEAGLLRAGYAYETATRWHLQQPDLDPDR